MARKRRLTPFNLSFLDVMSCGFGAVALVFLIIKHDTDTRVEVENQDLYAEVNMLEEEVREGRKQLVRAKNSVSALDEELVETRGLARRINESVSALRDKIAMLDEQDADQQVIALRQRLEELRREKEKLEQEQIDQGNDARAFVGQGQRQYLTGLKLGGARILIMVDASSSMLDDTLVNIIRRRNMSDEAKRTAPKWVRTLRTVDWLTAQFPQNSSYQLYWFNTDAASTVQGSEGTWLPISDAAKLEQAIVNLRKQVPNGGTSLQNAFAAINQFKELPDNIYLITDGLPTQGASTPRKGTVTGPEREKLFDVAVEMLPFGVPVNVILLPMEGDPDAAAEFWKLAQRSGGSFITPSRDWP